MDAAQKLPQNKGLLSTFALALILAAPGWSQTFTLSANSVNFNQSVTGAQVNVKSTGDPITFSIAPTTYANDNNGAQINWLGVTASSNTTPATLDLTLVSAAGSSIGTHTATVNLVSSS